ncbi:hypothetical protein D9757_007639 [Collybiopsis confluens]|uniref:Uncharacterized protein n=1 Tax=Collybiopsis confluens TaxID=2823264 RepID=A0A8H5H9W2_9AGAR|nr:hypothetical protein D9757_007639 [Collybiopsis confluens]
MSVNSYSQQASLWNTSNDSDPSERVKNLSLEFVYFYHEDFQPFQARVFKILALVDIDIETPDKKITLLTFLEVVSLAHTSMDLPLTMQMRQAQTAAFKNPSDWTRASF